MIFVRGDNGNNFSTGYVAENYVSGEVGSDSCGTLVLKDSTGAIKAQASPCANNYSFYTYLNDSYSNPISFQPGDTLEAAFAGQTTLVTIPTFSVTSNPKTSTVSGSTDALVDNAATPGQAKTLTVWPNSIYDSGSGKPVTLTVGLFSETNPFYPGADTTKTAETLTWSAGDQGHLRYIDANQNRVYADFWAARDKAQITVLKESNQVWGWLIQTDTDVTFSLKTADLSPKASATAHINQDGYFYVQFFDAGGSPVLILESDQVVVGVSPAITVPVVHLAILANPDTDLITGEGPPSTLLGLYVKQSWSDSVITDPSGIYSTNLAGKFDIRPGQRVYVDAINADGNTVRQQIYVGPKVSALLGTGSVWGYAPGANAVLMVTLKTGNVVKASATPKPSYNNSFSTYLYTPTGQSAVIQAGDTLVVDFGGGVVVNLPVSGLTAVPDVAKNQVSGTGPANALLGISVNSLHLPLTVPTDAKGEWTLDLAALKVVLNPGDAIRITYINPAPHEVLLYSMAPLLYLRAIGSDPDSYVADNYLLGNAYSLNGLKVSLKRSGAVLYSRQFQPSKNPWFSLYLTDAGGGPVILQAGDQVEVVGASNPFMITVPTLQATGDVFNHTVSGSGPPNANLGLYQYGFNITVPTDAQGAFNRVSMPSLNTDPLIMRYYDRLGSWTYAKIAITTTGSSLLKVGWDGNQVCPACVSGVSPAPLAQVTLHLKRAGATISTAAGMADKTSGFSLAFKDTSGNALSIIANDVIEMVISGVTSSLTVTPLTALANPVSGVLTGTGPAGAVLYISDQYWDEPISIVVGPDGRYSVMANSYQNYTGYIRYTDPAHNQIYLGWSAPYISVQEKGNRVGGTVALNTPVTVTVLTGSTVRASVVTQSNPSNGFFEVNLTSTTGHPLLIQPNDTVIVKADRIITTVPVIPLSAAVDPASDHITGSGPANKTLWVGVSSGLTVSVDASGAFVADFTNVQDLVAGDRAYIHYTNPDGNNVWIEARAPLVRINQTSDLVDGYATPNGSARLVLKRNGSLLARTTVPIDFNGFFSAFFPDAAGQTIDIQAGDVIEVSASSTVITPVVSLTAALDLAAGTVTGTGPANAILSLSIFPNDDGWSQPIYRSVTTDASGKYSLAVGGDISLTASSYVYVRYSNASGNQSSAGSVPTVLSLKSSLARQMLSMGAANQASSAGAANSGNLTPPLFYNHHGGGLVIRSFGGGLVVTSPDGTVMDSGSSSLTLIRAAAGRWKVQVRTWNYDGSRYLFGIGETGLWIFFPIVTN